MVTVVRTHVSFTLSVYLSCFDWHGVTFDGICSELNWARKQLICIMDIFQVPTQKILVKKIPSITSCLVFFRCSGERVFFLSVSIQIDNETTGGAWLWTDMRLQCGQKCNNNRRTIKRNAMTWRNDIALWSLIPPPPHSFTLPGPGPGHSYNQLRPLPTTTSTPVLQYPPYRNTVTRTFKLNMDIFILQ